MKFLQDYINESSQLLNTNQLLQNPFMTQIQNLLPVVQNQIPIQSEIEQKAYKFTLLF